MASKQITQQEKDLLKQLSYEMNELGLEGKPQTGIPVKWEGKGIRLPTSPTEMPIGTAVATLIHHHRMQEEVIHVQDFLHCYPEDAYIAFNEAMIEVFGEVMGGTIHTFFGDIPPKSRQIEVGPGEFRDVFVGKIDLPNTDGGFVYIDPDTEDCLRLGKVNIVSEVKNKHAPFVRKIFELAKSIAAKKSIYDKRAVRFLCNEHGKLQHPPKFIDPTQVKESELILNDVTNEAIKINLFAPIQMSEGCRRLGIPLKRGILLEGRYGTGKTLTAYVTALRCLENGWTFILVDDVRGLREAIEFAKRYQPCVIFAEDLDRVVGESRTDVANDVLNTIDGMLAKNSEIMVVLTTNHVESINKAMLRPGRLDAVISYDLPDPDCVVRFLRHYGGDLIDPNEDLTGAAEVLAGQVPSVLREVVERSKLYCLTTAETDTKLMVTGENIKMVALAMQRHLELLSDKQETVLSHGDQMLESMRAGLKNGGMSSEEMLKMTETIVREHLEHVGYEFDGLDRITG